MLYTDRQIELRIEGACFVPIETIVEWYRQEGETFLVRLRGTYWGELWDKEKEVRLVWNDHIGDKMVFYADTDQGLRYSTSLEELAKNVRMERSLQYDEQFLWTLLIYGYSPTCHTIYDGIRRIPAGKYLRIEKDKWSLCTYYQFEYHPNRYSAEENMREYDRLFRQAVQRALDYNKKHGYSNLIPLSAGLDSRMTACVARELAHEPITNVTYSQAGYYDEVIPRELAAYWGNKWVFRALDGGDYLCNLDDISRRTHGLINYTGAAQVADSFDRISITKGGIVLTGMIGDLLLNAHFSSKDGCKSYRVGEGAFVHDYIGEVQDRICEELELRNKEIGYIYVRGFYGMNLGSPLIQQEEGESYSPFYDVDVLEHTFSIPIKQRENYQLYDRWILTCYPDMARCLHNGRECIGHRGHKVSIMGRYMPLQDVPKRLMWYVLKKLGICDMYAQNASNSMNPEDDWLATNPRLRAFVDTYVSENMDRIPDSDLRQAAESLNTRSFVERSQVLTLLAALKNFPL